MTKPSTKQWNEFDKKISALIIAAMQHCSLTQVDLAEKIGMSQSNVSCLLNLERKRRDRHWTIPNLLRLFESEPPVVDLIFASIPIELKDLRACLMMSESSFTQYSV